MSLPHPKTFKCVLVGDGRTGKTSFVQRLLNGKFDRNYVSTQGVDVVSLEFNTSRGLLRFNVWDTAGQEHFSGLRDGYYMQGQCGIIMFDHLSYLSYKNVPAWHRDLVRVCAKIPLVLVGNKAEMRTQRSRNITYHTRVQLAYYDVSAFDNYNLEKPFLYLARQLMHDQKLVFIPKVASPPPPPPPPPATININAKVLAAVERELCDARKTELPPDNDISSSESD